MIDPITLNPRLRASATHLGASIVVAAVAASLVFALWYPTPYREISGGRELFLIVVAVDVVAGPLITLFVFDVRKPRKELTRDLAFVVLLQVCALAYGLHSVAMARPAAVALEGSRLRVVRALDLAEANWHRAPPELSRISWTGPLFVAARQPTSEERFEAIERGMAGQDIGMRPEFWLPGAQTGAAFAAAAMPIARLRTLHSKRASEVNAALATLIDNSSADSFGYLPLLARRSDWSAIVDRRDGKVIGFVPFDGF